MSGERWRKYVRQLGAPNEGTKRFYNRVKKSSTARGATFDVLKALIDNAEHKRNTVTMTRAQMGAEAHRGIWSVKEALAHLKKAQIIHAVAYGAGGRDCPTTYALLPAGEGHKREVNLAEGWGQDHPDWQYITAELREASLSRWNSVFCLLKFYSIEDGLLNVVAPNAWVAEKIETKYSQNLKEAGKTFGITDIYCTW